jgi:nitrogen fixation protein FixH
MKRTRSETRANYLLMLSDMWGQKRPFYLRGMVGGYNVNVNAGGALVELGYIGKTYQAGYYTWKSEQPTMKDVDVILQKLKAKKERPVFSTHDPKSTTSVSTQSVAEFVEAVDVAYPKQTELEKTIQLHIENDTIASREQAAIDILGTIMRDNAHITYDLIRIERKEVKTDLLAR